MSTSSPPSASNASNAGSVGESPYRRVPKDRYTGLQWAELERERLWPKVWQLACRVEDIPNAGDYFEYEIGDVSVLLVRPSRRTIKGYFNSCLHRGTQLKSGTGNDTELRCPFHGWCWALDGSNVEVVDQSDFPGLDPERLRLPECRVEVWAGFVFVNLDPSAPPLASFMEPITEQLSPYRLDDMRCLRWRSVKIPANWKTAIEAFNETYHLFATHPDSIAANDDVNTRYDMFPPHGRMITPVGIPSPRLEVRDGTKVTSEMVATLLSIQKVTPDQLAYVKLLRDGEIELPDGFAMQDLFAQMSRARLTKRGYGDGNLKPEQYGENWNYFVFPNICFNVLPGEFYGFRARPAGDDPNWCWFDEISMRFPEGGSQYVGHEIVEWSDDFDEREATWGHIVNQDFTNLPRIQRGLRAGGARHVHLSGYQESRIALMHRELERHLLDDDGQTDLERMVAVEPPQRNGSPSDGDPPGTMSPIGVEGSVG